MSSSRGLLFVISAPSGTGKTTLVERLVQEVPGLRVSRSYTSRAQRPGEQNGVDYHFIARETFEQRIAAQAFLEWADVFGHLYGTGASDVEEMQAAGQDVVLVIDVQGARQVRQRGTDHTAIFVMPPSREALEGRLRGRNSDSEAQVQRRLTTARAEVSSYPEYDYVVVNDDVDAAVARLCDIIAAERARMHRMRTVADAIVRTFFPGGGGR